MAPPVFPETVQYNGGENPLPEELQDRIDRAAPDGLRATGLRTLEPYGHALTTVIDTADYLVEIDGDAPSDLSARIEERVFVFFRRDH